MRPAALAAVLLLVAPAGADGPPVRAVRTATEVELFAGDEPVGRYKFAGDVGDTKPGRTKPLAKPVVWPVLAPGGVPVTRGWPLDRGTPGETTDHFHQKSAWFCHGDLIPEGVELKTRSADKHVKGVDFWSEAPGHGRIVCTGVGDPKAVAANHVAVPTRNEWRTPDGVKVLDEARTLHLVALPAGRLIGFDIELAARDCPVTFGDTKEAAAGVRVHDALRAEKKNPAPGTLVNSAGAAAEKSVWGHPADWCDYFGAVGGRAVGVAVFDHPGNPHRAAWHARAYGLLAANPFGRDGSGFPSQKGRADLVRLAKGESLRLRYAVYAHTGDTTEGRVAEAYKLFADMK